MSRPARSVITVTGTVSTNLPLNIGDSHHDDSGHREDRDQSDDRPAIAPGAEVAAGRRRDRRAQSVAALHGERFKPGRTVAWAGGDQLNPPRM